MRLGGRTQAAIEVLTDLQKNKRPVSLALKDWGVSHRFAGSGDRAAIGNLVYDALRQRASTVHVMGSDKPRSIVLGTLLRQWGYKPDTLLKAFVGDRFAPEHLTEESFAKFDPDRLAAAEPHIQADIPQWCVASFEENFADDWVAEARAFTRRPSLDLRANTLKADQAKVLKALKKAGAKSAEIARYGIRIPPGSGPSRTPNVEAEAGYQKGWFEVQDEGSQIVADLVFPQPGEQVLDYCAGAGGKTLALGAAMQNKGQIHAYDRDRSRLKPIYERIKRAGLRNVQVHSPDDDLSALAGSMHKVVVDAPCTGSGTWRRRPDAKWKLTAENLAERVREQEEALSEAAPFVRPGGFLIYITCSVFPEENEAQVYAFCEDSPEFELVSAGEVWQDLFGFEKAQPWSSDMKTITLTPASTNTDGFFFSVMERRG